MNQETRNEIISVSSSITVDRRDNRFAFGHAESVKYFLHVTTLVHPDLALTLGKLYSQAVARLTKILNLELLDQ